MVSSKTDRMLQEAGKALNQAVREELLKKSKLGQYAIIERDGKPCRILASELIKNKSFSAAPMVSEDTTEYNSESDKDS